MKVFADFHHDDLYHSLHLLFEKRLGWELYCPIGADWYTKGYWKYSPEPRVIQQYLESGRKWEDKGDHCLVENPVHDRKIKALTLDQFKEMEIDIIVSSVPNHVYTYRRLIKDFQPKAKLIQQVGNEWKEFDYTTVQNLMISTSPFNIPANINTVFYHQEFDTDLFDYEPGNPKNPIKSFVNDLSNLKDWKLFLSYEKSLPQWEWKSYGLGCRDGNVRPLAKLVKEMRDSSFIFHAKSLGDGFGHIIHNIFALGRPAIVRSRWYKNREAEPLLLDGITCIDLDKHLKWQNIELIKACSTSAKYHRMCQDARKRFEDVVNYEVEFIKIKRFLDNLK